MASGFGPCQTPRPGYTLVTRCSSAIRAISKPRRKSRMCFAIHSSARCRHGADHADERFWAAAMRARACGTLSISAPRDGTSSCTSGSCASMNTPLWVASPIAWKKSAVCSTVTPVATMHSMRAQICSAGASCAPRGRRDRRLERGQRFPDVVIAHVVQGERARHARGDVDACRARDHHEFRAALALEHAIGLRVRAALRAPCRDARRTAARAPSPAGSRSPSLMERVGDALEQRGGHLAVGRLDADGLEFGAPQLARRLRRRCGLRDPCVHAVAS